MPNKEARNERYEAGSEVQQYLYSDWRSGNALMAIAQKYDLDREPAYTKFALAVGDVILGFYTTDDIVSLLQSELNLNKDITELIAVDVLNFLLPLSDQNWAYSGDDNVDLSAEAVLESAKINVPRPPASTTASQQVGYNSTEENTYTSTQSAIINESK